MTKDEILAELDGADCCVGCIEGWSQQVSRVVGVPVREEAS